MRTRVARLSSKPATRLAAVAAVLFVVSVGLYAVFRSAPSRVEPALLESPITVKRALSATAALFGDRIEAEVDVYTDDRAVDRRSVRLRTTFAPYRAVATKVERSRRGHVSLLRTRIVLACLTKACVPPTTGAILRFRPAEVTFRAASRDKRIEIPWGPVQIASRIPSDSTARVGVIDTAPPLDPRFAISPGLLHALLLVAVALLGLGGVALVVTGLWPPLFSLRRAPLLSPLETSLREVEAAAQAGDTTARRRVLEQLATRLGELPSPSLEARTRSLAWAEDTPEPEALTRLVQQVRTSVNGVVRR